MLTDVKVYPQEGLKSLAITKAKYEEYYLDVRAYERLLKKKERMLTKLEETYKDNIEKLIELYMQNAIKSDRITINNELKKAGLKEAADLIRKL